MPDDCRVCGLPLHNASRIPVCPSCLAKPQPLTSDFFCTCCRTPFRNQSPLDEQGRCALCRTGWPGFDAAYSFGSFDNELRELIHIFKYGRVQALAKPLGRYLRQALPAGERFDAVTPMPLHWTRRWSRGFNQSALLAREISRGTGFPVLPAVRRVRRTAAQAGLTRAGRRGNVARAFTVRNPDRIRGKRILLVDDVMTTGATAASCARALKKAGAARVALLTLARADRRDFSVFHLSSDARSAKNA
ncbi:MAG TPA: ComF family protein [Bryobacteraceae bacterium]|nr:ComF family protein [Bryobacteraceae bacterium]